MIKSSVFTKTRKGAVMSEIYLRLSPKHGGRLDFSLNAKVKPNHWVTGGGKCKVVGKMSEEDKKHNERVNDHIVEQTSIYIKAWDKLHELGQKIITARDIKQFINGTHEKSLYKERRLTFGEACDLYLAYKKTKIKAVRERKYNLDRISIHLEALGKKDLTLDNFSTRVVSQLLEYWEVCPIKTTGNRQGVTYSPNSKSRLLSEIKQLFTYFYQNEHSLPFLPLLPMRNPLEYAKIVLSNDNKEVEKLRGKLRDFHFYTDKEISMIKSVSLNHKLNYYRNILLFQINTGISRVDLRVIDPDLHIEDKGVDGRWISSTRIKTNELFYVLITPEIERLIHYFQTHSILCKGSKSSGIIKWGNNSTLHRRLGNVSDALGFKVTETHKARHTFAMRKLNNERVPMEVVSKMLGHGRVSTTEGSYATLTLNGLISDEKARKQSNLQVVASKLTGS